MKPGKTSTIMIDELETLISVTGYDGWDSADAAGCFETAAAAARTASDGVGVVRVPAGNIYTIATFVDSIVNVGFDQDAPRYAGAQAPNWAIDGAMYGTATEPAKTWKVLEGYSDTDGDFFTQFLGIGVVPTASPVDYIKGPIYWRGKSYDPSDVGGGIDRDVSALGQGIIATGNMTGRAWALDLVGHVESGADGLLTVLELNCLNQGTTQNNLNTSTTKNGLRIFASLGAITSAIHIDFDSSSSSNEFFHAISINPTAIATGGYAFLLDGVAAIMATGAAAFGTETPRAGYVMTLDSAGGTKMAILSDGANESSVVHIDVGTTAWASGLHNTSAEWRLANSEVLTTGIAISVATSTLRVGLNKTAPDYQLHVNGTFGFAPGASVTPVANGDVVMQFTNNTTLTFKGKGTDGVVRSWSGTLS